MHRSIMLQGRSYSYELERKNVKNINLRLRPDGSIYVSANRRVPERVISEFITAQAEYIIAALRRFEQQARAVPSAVDYSDGERLCFFGEELSIRVLAAKKTSVERRGGELWLQVREPDNKKQREAAVDKWQRAQCREAVEALCREVYPMFAPYGIEYPEIKLRRMRSRWGSCAPGKRQLTFNTALVGAPMECIRYVVIHEFTHFLQADHSKLFYEKLESFMPDWKLRKRELSGYGRLIK